MPRQLRLEYHGAVYHVMNRGDRREDIFRDDEDRRLFLSTLAEACQKTLWQVHAYCLMRNHFHLVFETPEANLVAGMKWLLGVYTKRFNRSKPKSSKSRFGAAGVWGARNSGGSCWRKPGGGRVRTITGATAPRAARSGPAAWWWRNSSA